MLHLVELEELTDDFGAQKSIIVPHHFPCYCRVETALLKVLGSTSETLFLFICKYTDHFRTQTCLQFVNLPFILKLLKYLDLGVIVLISFQLTVLHHLDLIVCYVNYFLSLNLLSNLNF